MKKKKKKEKRSMCPHDALIAKVVRNYGEPAFYRIDTAPARALNNFVKAVLIETYVPMGARVLDLACGKGGDIGKYARRRIRSWCGVDVVGASVKEAMSRYNRGARYEFAAQFFVHDLSATEFVCPDTVDCVSCQFAVHYFF